jgi:anti-sigma factor RsiW
MNSEDNGSCKEFSSLLVKKISGEIASHEKPALESHLAQCASCAIEERELSAIWQRFDSLPVPEIPTELHENTRGLVLGHLKREKPRFAWFSKVSLTRRWGALIPLTAGLAMTAVSYGLIHRFIDPSVHHQYFLLPFFSLWWLLFSAGFWAILENKAPNLVCASSVSITLLTLVIAFLAYELEAVRGVAMSAAYEIAVATDYLFGVGNTFVAAWWIHCCLASFIGAFIFGVSTSPRSSANLFIGSLVVMILLSPAIYLQGASHNHGLGVIAFAAAGTYVGALVGMGLGLFIRRQFSFQLA